MTYSIVTRELSFHMYSPVSVPDFPFAALGRNIKLMECKGHHAFFGFPIAWNFQWQENTWPAFLEILDFVGLPAKPIIPNWPRDVSFDWALPIIIVRYPRARYLSVTVSNLCQSSAAHWSAAIHNLCTISICLTIIGMP